jgi:hypothetical protein
VSEANQKVEELALIRRDVNSGKCRGGVCLHDGFESSVRKMKLLGEIAIHCRPLIL